MLPQAVATTATVVAEAWTSKSSFRHYKLYIKRRGPEGPRLLCRRRVMPTKLAQLRSAQAADGVNA